MWTLIKKDMGVNQVAIVGHIAMVAGAYLLMITIALSSGWREVAPQAMSGAAGLSLLLTALMAAAYGGMAFAEERRQRSSDFLAMMPVSRGNVLLSKLIVAGVCISFMAILNGAVMLALSTRMDPSRTQDFLHFSIAFLLATPVLFGIAWLFSTFMTSPAHCAAIAIGTTIGLIILIVSAMSHFDSQRSRALTLIFIIVCSLLLGIGCVIFGTRYYVRRIEP